MEQHATLDPRADVDVVKDRQVKGPGQHRLFKVKLRVLDDADLHFWMGDVKPLHELGHYERQQRGKTPHHHFAGQFSP